MFENYLTLIPIILAALLVAFLIFGQTIFGWVRIGEREVGIVIKKFASKSLPPGCMIALNGEAGYQAETLGPGIHFGYRWFQYRIQRVPVIEVPAGQIALVLANDGQSIPSDRILGQVVDCKNFQDARAFLTNGGEKGRQLGFLTAGSYRINWALFTVITARSAPEFGMAPSSFLVYEVRANSLGIVTTLDGKPISRRRNCRARGAEPR